jgi:RimJ/RimL family protein N-acetyltransferase
MKQFLTKRLRIREWQETDRYPFSEMNADPKVMEFFPAVLTKVESDVLIERCKQHFDTHGFAFWALELKETGDFIGFTGLMIPNFRSHFTPCVEIGWRVAFPFWNKGFATEAAFAVLQFAFEKIDLQEIVSFTTSQNLASRRVMEKIGMTRNPADDFEHPKLPKSHPLSKHVLYRISKKVQNNAAQFEA